MDCSQGDDLSCRSPASWQRLHLTLKIVLDPRQGAEQYYLLTITFRCARED